MLVDRRDFLDIEQVEHLQLSHKANFRQFKRVRQRCVKRKVPRRTTTSTTSVLLVDLGRLSLSTVTSTYAATCKVAGIGEQVEGIP